MPSSRQRTSPPVNGPTRGRPAINPVLGGLSPGQFLAQYWQKKPLLIRQALPALNSLVTPGELAGLAMEEGVESRLVRELTATDSWQVEYGPFTEDTFRNLPDSHWTLLVQHVDQWIPEIAALLEHFRFIPNWRIDDIMVSYAAVHGSVGPHLDSYDVFLLQADGKRRWMINETDYSEDDFVHGLELRVIDNFQANYEWELQAGDMLYLPPGMAHHGIALEPGMTCSVGFRAPSGSELLHEYIMDTQELSGHDPRFTDPDREVQEHPGEILSRDIEHLYTLLTDSLGTPEAFANWYGCYVTRPIPETGEPPHKEVPAMISSARCVHCDLRSKRVFIRRDDSITLFANGEKYELPLSLLELVSCITEGQSLSGSGLSSLQDDQQAITLLENLVNKGVLYCE